MKGLKEIWGLVLPYFLVISVPWVFSHTDPPVMTLKIYPGMPTVSEEAKIKINLRGSNAGVPVLGAKIKIVLTDRDGNRLYFKVKPGDNGGDYLSTMDLPRPGMWKMRIEVKHQNELDFRHYMIRVISSDSGPQKVMKDETFLAMDKKDAHQPIPPLLVVEGYVFLILLLLATVSIIKRIQVGK
ncbi:hypothetical protein LCGC14_2264850 [marine sediment metagenome]|uniref:YtkA-like domain-containing protein n=1 Tax=marine sediment metagenome TaxID=412755 RepID=A0A0F9CYW7_9ZZZZ|nr:hypothetical protein [Desulfobacterales bacterium]